MGLNKPPFPPEYRSFRGKRWLLIALRTAHLMGAAGMAGGILFQAAREAWTPYLTLTVASGLALAFLEVWSSAVWLIQVCGLAVLLKLGITIVMATCPDAVRGYEPHLLAFIIVISGVSSHAPRSVRHYSVLHGRRVDAP